MGKTFLCLINRNKKKYFSNVYDSFFIIIIIKVRGKELEGEMEGRNDDAMVDENVTG